MCKHWQQEWHQVSHPSIHLKYKIFISLTLWSKRASPQTNPAYHSRSTTQHSIISSNNNHLRLPCAVQDPCDTWHMTFFHSSCSALVMLHHQPSSINIYFLYAMLHHTIKLSYEQSVCCWKDFFSAGDIFARSSHPILASLWNYFQYKNNLIK